MINAITGKFADRRETIQAFWLVRNGVEPLMVLIVQQLYSDPVG